MPRPFTADMPVEEAEARVLATLEKVGGGPLPFELVANISEIFTSVEKNNLRTVLRRMVAFGPLQETPAGYSIKEPVADESGAEANAPESEDTAAAPWWKFWL